MRCIRRSGLKCPDVFNKKPEKAGSTFPVEIDFGSAQAETRFSAKVLRVISSALADLWQQVPTGIGLGIHLLRNNRKDQMRRMFRVVINGLVGFQQLCIGSEG